MSGYGRSRYRRLGLLFCAIGLAVFLASTARGILTIAASGFGAFLIGVLLAYLSFVPTVPSELVGSTLMPAMNNLEALLKGFGVDAYATYIHPNSKEESFRVFIPLSEQATRDPPTSKTTNEIVIVPSEDSRANGLLLEPPGADLLSLIERESGQEIWAVELTGLQEALRTGIVRSLELASSVRLTFEGSECRLLVEGDVLGKFTQELVEKAPIMCERVGCPICSLVACALAKSSHGDVRFRGAKHFDGKHDALYELLGEAK
jgi:hypothetical protein